MKNKLQILVAFIYLLGAFWVPLHAHHCGDELTSLSVYTGQFGSDNCDCEDIGNTDCCSDEVIQSDNKTQNVVPKILQAPQSFVSTYFIGSAIFLVQTNSLKVDSRFLYSLIKSPPYLGRTNIELCVFRI